MDRETLMNLLPGLSGHFTLKLTDAQLARLLQAYKRDIDIPVSSIVSRDGYLELSASMKAPIVGQIEIKPQIAVEAIEVSSRRMVIKARILNVNMIIQKAISYLIGRFGLDMQMNNGVLSLNLTDRWIRSISDMPAEAKKKLDGIGTDIAIRSGVMEIGIRVE